jgi:hypothetical protein
MQLLLDGGKDVNDLLSVAYAMERGDDARAVYRLIDDLKAINASDRVVAVAVCGLAEAINANNRSSAPFVRDEFTEDRDSNRSRRAMPDTEWRVLRQQIFARDEYVCQYCGANEDLTCDHIIPLSRGGTNDDDNLTTACRSCNSSKGSRLLSEWRGCYQ